MSRPARMEWVRTMVRVPGTTGDLAEATCYLCDASGPLYRWRVGERVHGAEQEQFVCGRCREKVH